MRFGAILGPPEVRAGVASPVRLGGASVGWRSSFVSLRHLSMASLVSEAQQSRQPGRRLLARSSCQTYGASMGALLGDPFSAGLVGFAPACE